MDWVGLVFLFRYGPSVIYGVRREDAERVIRQFSLGELPKTLDSTRVHCTSDTRPWAIKTEDLILIQQCPVPGTQPAGTVPTPPEPARQVILPLGGGR